MYKFAPPRPRLWGPNRNKPTQIRTPSWKTTQRRTYRRRGVQIRLGLEPGDFCAPDKIRPRSTQRAQRSKKFEISIEIENFDREWNFRASHPPRHYFLWGNRDIEIKNFERDQKVRSRLKISIEIKFFWSLGPLSNLYGADGKRRQEQGQQASEVLRGFGVSERVSERPPEDLWEDPLHWRTGQRMHLFEVSRRPLGALSEPLSECHVPLRAAGPVAPTVAEKNDIYQTLGGGNMSRISEYYIFVLLICLWNM